MEKRDTSGRPLFVDDETSILIHPRNIADHHIVQENWESLDIFYRYGRWSVEEKQKLLENWKAYLEENRMIIGDMDPETLLHSSRKQNQDLLDLIRITDFYVRISKNLNRSTYACYKKLCRELKLQNFENGRFSSDDIQLMKNMAENGESYQRIAEELNRDQQSVKDCYRRHKKCTNQGHWTHEEDELLVQVLKDITGIDDLAKLKQLEIPWRKVALRIPSRHEEQCRTHFFGLKHWKLEDLSTPVRWRKYHNRLLLNKITSHDYQVETDIDWVELYQDFKDVSPSPAYLQRQFHIIKSSLPDYQRKTFDEVLDEMQKEVL